MALEMTKADVSKMITDAIGAALPGAVDEAVSAAADKSVSSRIEEIIASGKAPGRLDNPGPTEEKGLRFARVVRMAALSKCDATKAYELAKAQYGEDDSVTAVLFRAANISEDKALSASLLSEGGVLVDEEVSAEVIELLRARSTVRTLNPRNPEMNNGNLTLPKLTGGATAGYIGENQQAGATEQTFGQIKFSAKKLAALVPISNDLLRFSSRNNEAMIRDDLVDSIVEVEDVNFIRGTGGVFAPAGLATLMAAGQIVASGGTTLALIMADLMDCMGRLEDANVNVTNGGWIMSHRSKRRLMGLRGTDTTFAFPEIAATGMLLGWPLAATSQIPNNLGGGSNESEVYFANFNDVVLADSMTVEIATSSEATYRDSGANIISAFQSDQTLIRAITQHDLNLRHDVAAAQISAVIWA